MNLMILILGNIIICLLVFSMTKDFLHPGFIFCIPWIIFLILLSLSDYNYDASSFCYIYFFIGTIVFELGCFLGHTKIKRKERLNENISPYYHVNYQSLNLLLIIECIFVLYVLYNYLTFMRSNYTTNIFQTFHSNQDKIPHMGLISYGRNIFSAFGICMVVGYSHVHPKEREKYKKYILIQLLMYFVITLSGVTRNQMLFAALPFFMAFIVVTKQKNTQVFKKMFIAVSVFLIVFCVIAVMKYSSVFANGNYFDKLFDQIVLYGSGGIVAFQKQFDARNFLNYEGANTFRFFQALFDKIAGTHYAMPLVQEFTSIGLNETTNVYTFYRWYYNDFGTFYALIIQFLVGIVHGISYREMSKMKLYGIYMYCILIHPLVMQIFQDQYFSLTSSWIQYFIVGFIFLKTNILFSRSTQRNSIVLYMAH